MEFSNTYEDNNRAAAYDQLEWGGTYLLVFNWLTETLRHRTPGTRALDFGCGTGRSTRLLKALGFSAIGIDISKEMVARARQRDNAGDYRVITDGDFSSLQDQRFDLILS
ncbi:MAG TPA: class I SAM-dependent methyltransferase, partial [candidate division Zixibacteria bacterium]|nr:class I SAM-dependent methyltransferase [candidate division Zixibacteria bacterium]